MKHLIILFSFILLTLTAETCKKQSSSLQKAVFNKHWVHSFEEDTADIKVYRPVTYNFPLARGREGFEVKENNTFILYTIGPADESKKVEGKWSNTGKNMIQAGFTSSDVAPYSIEILQVSDTLLTIRK